MSQTTKVFTNQLSFDLPTPDVYRGTATITSSSFTMPASGLGTVYRITTGAGCTISLPDASTSEPTTSYAQGNNNLPHNFFDGWWAEISNFTNSNSFINTSTSTINGTSSIDLAPFSNIHLASIGGNWIADYGTRSPFAHGMGTNNVTFSMTDDSVTRLNNLRGNGILRVVVTAFSGDNRGAMGDIRHQSGIGTDTVVGGGSFAHLSASDTAPGGTSGTDGFLSFQVDVTGGTPRIWLNNRLGATVTVRVYPFIPNATSAGITATGL